MFKTALPLTSSSCTKVLTTRPIQIVFSAIISKYNETECPKDKEAVFDNLGHIIEPIHNPAYVPQPKAAHKPEEHEVFGSWMLVKKPIRRRVPRPEKPIPATDPPVQDAGTVAQPRKVTEILAEKNLVTTTNLATSSGNCGDGSRFAILKDQLGEEEAPNQDLNTSNMEEDIFFPTVDLGKSTLPSIDIENQPLSFIMGSKSTKTSKKKSTKSLTKEISGKSKSSLHSPSLALSEINLNTPTEKAHKQNPKTNYAPLPGKENSHLLSQAITTNLPSQASDSAFQKPSYQESSQDVSKVPVTPQCYSVEHPPGENSLHKPCDGETLPLCDRPPDPYIGSEDRFLAGTYLDAQGISDDTSSPQ